MYGGVDVKPCAVLNLELDEDKVITWCLGHTSRGIAARTKCHPPSNLVIVLTELSRFPVIILNKVLYVPFDEQLKGTAINVCT
jgi:hypothetical protein